MSLSRTKQGDFTILGGTLIWSFFPLMSLLLVHRLPPIFAAGVGTLIAAVFFAILITIRRQWYTMLNRKGWGQMMVVVLCITMLYYGGLFWAAQYTSPGNFGILNMSEIFWSFLVIGILTKHESFTWEGIVGTLLMVLGALIIIFPGTLEFNWVDLAIVFINIPPTLGNIYQRKARQHFSSEQMLFIRSFIGGFMLLGLSHLFGETFPTQIDPDSWKLLLLLGVVFFGVHKILWIEGINRIAITKANAIHAIAPIFTLLWVFLWWDESPTLYQVAGFIPILIGAWLVTLKKDIFKIIKI